MRIFDNKNIGINVLAVVVAMGVNASCQKRQNAPKNEPERLMETPNGKGKEAYSRADSPKSSKSSEKHVGATSTSVTPESEKHRPYIANDSDDAKAVSSKEESNSSQSNVLQIPETLKWFVSPGHGCPVIDSGSILWEDSGFARMLGREEKLLVSSVRSRRFFFSNRVNVEQNVEQVRGTIATVLLKIRKQSSGEDFFVFVVVVDMVNKKDPKCDVLISKTINDLEERIYRGRSLSLVQCAIDWVGSWEGFEKIKGVTAYEWLSGSNGTYQYGDDVFDRFE